MAIPFFTNSLIDKVLSRDEFINQPPVLVDIGASGTIHKKWKRLAKYSICIAFDADTRDFNPAPAIAKHYKKLFVKNALVTDHGSTEVDFYLTKSPYCSSLLRPRNELLEKWAFSPLFELDKTIQLKATNLVSVLEELKLDRIDWLKVDTQGTDLRLFKSVPDKIQNKIICAEFEPGIIDAYNGEDKLYSVLSFMDTTKKFWLSELVIKGTTRIPYSSLKEIFPNRFIQKVIGRVGTISPGWGEMTFLNSFNDISIFSQRDVLLSWVCATLQGQHGFALEVAKLGSQNYKDPVFDKLIRYSTSKVKMWLVSRKYFSLVLKKIGFLD